MLSTDRLICLNCLIGVVLLGPIRGSANDSAACVLVENGTPKATIVLADKPSPCAAEAAEALRSVLERMSGARLTIQKESKVQGSETVILVGMSEAVRKAGIEIPQDEDAGDHYVIRADPRQIILAGNDGGQLRGSAYAVYDCLERLGCGWYGPDPAWHVIPKRDTLSVPALRVDEKPAFAFRNNWLASSQGPPLTDAWRLGGKYINQSHAFDSLIPREKYIQEHPEYFGPKQPCLTNPDVIEIVTNQFRARLDQEKGIVSFSVSANDALGFCDCPRCRAVGNAGALNLHFANAIARNLAQTHPNRYLLTFYAFWGTHDAPFPPLKAEPGVCVVIVNEGNHLHPLDEPERPDISQIIDRNNTRELIALDGWKHTGAILGIYEWWIPACNHEDWKKGPWYSVDTTLRNLRFWKRQGAKYLMYQSGDEKGNGFPLRWPLYYASARGMWNPDVDARQIMSQACEKLYGPAGESMQRYYHVFEQAMDACPIPAKSWRLPSPEKIYSPQTESTAARVLDEAEKLATDPDAKVRIAQERALFDQFRKLLADLRNSPRESTPSNANPGM